MDNIAAMKEFGIESMHGITAASLKALFRKLSMVAHPDTGGNQDAFLALTAAYDTLKDHVDDGHDDQLKDNYLCGKPLSYYGNGYPITESARTCECCDGKGYKEYDQLVDDGEEVDCEVCSGTGIFSLLCNKCGGSGRFERNGKDVGECYRCKGTGRFYPKYRGPSRSRVDFFWGKWDPVVYIPGTMIRGQHCKSCNGTGSGGTKPVYKKALTVCAECKGVGEIKMWNPVLPRGLFSR